MMEKVIHGVKDRLTGELICKTQPGSFFETHQIAESWCKKNLGERGEIVRLDVDKDGQKK